MSNNSKYPVFIIACLVASIFWQCNTSSKTESESMDSTGAQPSVQQEEPITDNTTLVSLITTTKTGADRMSQIGNSISNITAIEQSAKTDSASNFDGYTVNFNDLEDEFVDIQYFFDGQKIIGINMDIYLNDEKQVKNLAGNLESKFDKEYKKGGIVNGIKTWTNAKNEQISLKDVSVKLAPGLKLMVSKNPNT